jgi:deoxycytidylate deaminase/dephospho-CoA kinase
MSMKNAIDEIYLHRDNFIIIGLTGRSGSGCSKAADILSKDFDNMNLQEPGFAKNATNTDRKNAIIYKFAKRHWNPFFVIRARDIITTFILECRADEIDELLKTNGVACGIGPIKAKYEEFFNLNKVIDPLIIKDFKNIDEDAIYNYLKSKLPLFTEELKQFIDHNSDKKFIPIYQQVGDNIRKNGIALPNRDINVEHIYALAYRINLVIKSIRNRNKRIRESNKYRLPKDYFVIDAFRNPFEAMFFKERYSAFYLIAINVLEEDRIDRLREKFDLSPSKIQEIDEKEYPLSKPLKNYSNFISQNIASCIQMSDIHIHNPGKIKYDNCNQLRDQLVKFVSLIQHPGIITPSKHEKLMQIAFTAKLNSGCLSRQVGAVVTNKFRAVKAIGWNSSPDEQVPCILRNIDALLSNMDQEAYSSYEQSDIQFRKIAQEYRSSLPTDDIVGGLNISYCFKDLQNKKDKNKNQVHNRALHAEENAFLQIAKYGGEGVNEGFLYTTASPCDSCARKAYQIGISNVVYIDPYPGIAIDHVIKSGSKNINLILFNGAIGRAYHQLYTPLISIKDEIEGLMP